MGGIFYTALGAILIIVKFVNADDAKNLPADDLKSLYLSLTPEERMQIFNTNSDEVPKFGITTVNWPKHHKRSSDGSITLPLNVFNEKINLNLKQPTSLVGPKTPVYNFYTQGYRVICDTDYPFANSDVDIYEDEDNMASLTLTTDENGAKQIQTAVIGAKNVTLNRIPDRLLSREQFKNVGIGNYITQMIGNALGVYRNPIRTPRQFFNNNAAPNIPDVIYPEVLLLIDFALTQSFYNTKDLLSYTLIFWNQVDMMYRKIDKPKYRISLSGLAIAHDKTAFSFVSTQNRYIKSTDDQLSFKGALLSAGDWLYANQNIIPFNSYDLAIGQTTRMSTQRGIFGTSQQLGLAQMSAACAVDHHQQRRFGIGFAYDDAKFGGVETAAHELAHILGVNHDEEMCPRGYLMYPTTSPNSRNVRKWSPCSIRDFRKFLTTNPECLYNVPEQYQPKSPQNTSNSNGNAANDNEVGDNDNNETIKNNLNKIIPGTNTKYSDINFNEPYNLSDIINGEHTTVLDPRKIPNNLVLLIWIKNGKVYQFLVKRGKENDYQQQQFMGRSNGSPDDMPRRIVPRSISDNSTPHLISQKNDILDEGLSPLDDYDQAYSEFGREMMSDRYDNANTVRRKRH